MDTFEIAIWKFVMPPTFSSVLVVYAQEPFAVLGEPIFLDEVILGLRGRMVVAPRLPFVIDKLTLTDKSLGVLICAVVELHGHAVRLLIGYGGGYYGDGYYGNGRYWGTYAAGAATGTAVGAAAASNNRSSTTNYYNASPYYYTCWDAYNRRYYSSSVQCSQR
jgi:hypothetical protein